MDYAHVWERLDASLRQKELDLNASLNLAKRDIQAKAAMAGSLRSGGTLKMLVRAVEENLLQFCQEVFSLAQNWRNVKGIEEEKLRTTVVAFLQKVLAAYPEADYVSYGGMMEGSAAEAISGMIEGIKRKVQVQIDEFALGVGIGPSPAGTTNILHAGTIIGGVQQGTIASTQSNDVEVSNNDLAQALEVISTQLVASGFGQVAHDIQADIDTIKAQLTKPEPSNGILREAAKSIKAITEGAIGGAIGTALSPQFQSAFTVLTSFVTS